MVASAYETYNELKETRAYNQGFLNGFMTGTIISCAMVIIASAILIHKNPSSELHFLRN